MNRELILEGEAVRLEPLARKHLPALVANCNDPELWRYTFQPNPFTNERDTEAWLVEGTQNPSVLAFAIIDKASGDVAGSTRYLDISPEHRKLEIGHTFLTQRFWRTRLNTEMKFLLFRHAFETWNAVRVQLKAEAINSRSHRAILRLGAVHEGTLRNFRIRPVDGSVRDVAFYSVIDSEWPTVKSRLLSFLDRIPDSRAAK